MLFIPSNSSVRPKFWLDNIFINYSIRSNNDYYTSTKANQFFFASVHTNMQEMI